MEVVWDKGANAVGEVVAALPGDPGLAYNTVLTTLRILEQKGSLPDSETPLAFTGEL
jgi:predicted transcriptional regulator